MMLKKLGIKLLLIICCAVIFITGSKLFAGTAYKDNSSINAKIILCASSSDIDQEAVIDDDDKDAQKDIDKEAVIDDDNKNAQKEVDKNAIIDDDSDN